MIPLLLGLKHSLALGFDWILERNNVSGMSGAVDGLGSFMAYKASVAFPLRFSLSNVYTLDSTGSYHS